MQSEGTAAIAAVMLVLMASSSVEAAVTPQSSQAIAGFLTGFASGVVSTITGAVDGALSLPAAAVANPYSATLNLNTNSDLNSNTPSTTVIAPTGGKALQTAGQDFRIQPHLVTTANDYVYVTGSGNYTFPKEEPYQLSIVWLNGNVSMPLSEYNVIQGHSLSHGTSTVTAEKNGYHVTSQEMAGATVMGSLEIFYNFTSYPFKQAATYSTLSTAPFNIELFTSGGAYVARPGQSPQSAESISSTATNASLGSLASVGIYRSSLSPLYDVIVDVSDAGTAKFVYGHTPVDTQAKTGVTAVFATNQATIDPSVYQTNNCHGTAYSGTCSYSSNVTAFDLLVVGVTYDPSASTTVTVSDSIGNYWQTAVTKYGDSRTVTAIFYTIDSTSTSDTVTIKNSSDTNLGGTNYNIYLLEVSSINGANIYASPGSTGSCALNCGVVTLSAGVTPFSGYDLLFGVGYSVGDQLGTSGVETGYTTIQTYYQEGLAIYSTSGVSSPTSFTMKTCGISCNPLNNPVNWNDVGVVFLTDAQPIKATATGGASSGTIALSGCNVSTPSIPGDGNAHTVYAAASCGITATAPAGDVWTGGGPTNTIFTCAGGGTCSTKSYTYQLVVQPITATLSTPGSIQTVTASTCDAQPGSWTGGLLEDVEAQGNCYITLTLPGSSGYFWINGSNPGTNVAEVLTCNSSSANCSDYHLAYSAPPTLNVEPNGMEPVTSFVNLTGSTPKVLVTLYGGNHNNLNGASCAKAPCTPPSGNWSFQFNIVFPKSLVHNPNPLKNNETYDYCPMNNSSCGPFMVQATVEAYQNGTCKAEPQGAISSPPAPDVNPQASFGCGAITSPGATFAWVVDRSAGTNGNLTDIKFQINGVTNATWYPTGLLGDIFFMHGAPANITMSDVYAQSVFSGGSGGPYGNFYSGGGSLSYTGAQAFNCEGTCPHIFTSEYSNTEYTSILSSGTSFIQAFNAGVFANVYESSSGSVSNSSYSIGPPSGKYAELQALTSGSTACLEDAFVSGGPVVDGTIAIYGYSKLGDTSSVQVAVSTSSSSSCSSGTGWTTVYTKSWSGSSAAAWIPLNSASQVEYVKITASYSGRAADIYVGSISMFMGSYGESQTHSTRGVTNPSYALGVNDTREAGLQESGGSISWIQVGLGAMYSGDLLIRGNVSAGVTVAVQYSSTGAAGSWTTDGNCTGSGSSLTWIDCGGISQALYVLITVSYGTQAGKLSLDAVYIA